MYRYVVAGEYHSSDSVFIESFKCLLPSSVPHLKPVNTQDPFPMSKANKLKIFCYHLLYTYVYIFLVQNKFIQYNFQYFQNYSSHCWAAKNSNIRNLIVQIDSALVSAKRNNSLHTHWALDQKGLVQANFFYGQRRVNIFLRCHSQEKFKF